MRSDALPLGLEAFFANWFLRPAVPVSCVRLVAFFAMQVGVNPRSIGALSSWADSWARVQSPFASHQSPASAEES